MSHSGLLNAKGALIALVLVGTCFSVAVDYRDYVVKAREVDEQQAVIQELNHKLMESRQALSVKRQAEDAEAEIYQSMLSSVDGNAEKLALLESSKSDLEAGLNGLESEFEVYRKSYREQEFQTAVGEHYRHLTTSDGKVYDDVTIRKVTPVGLEVRHKSGIARIHASALPAKWQERFQWNDEERRGQLEKERLVLVMASIRKSEAEIAQSKLRRARALSRLNSEGKEKIREALSQNVLKWDNVLLGLHDQLIDAKFASKGHASVPDGLETWKTRMNRISRRIDYATQELHEARAKLDQLPQ
ncbi:hypothetical protein JIN85_18860 [Luteolibacter pohnpeiensis]|uniref:Uncharacterized protein n=1 Tax=Luteolibacter pohnpeiensis TaxID=454153 RepID=A0A934SEM2_9BACT|nr:hypothetical protein [Luteolibacter pohnpeiensis]MBK1884484.1 hypothetical protein [Luteolibacter pohnpeiensis]